MKKILLCLLASALSFGVFGKPMGYKIEPKESTVKWLGEKVAGKHFGKVKVKAGAFQLEGNDLVGGRVLIDMTSITVDDIENKEWNGKLVAHLKNDDFFSVDKHKEAILLVKNAMMAKGGGYDVNGELTIKGVTKPIMFKVKLDKKDKVVKAKGSFTFDRTLYGIKYNSGKFFSELGDKMIKDQVKVDFDVVAKAN